MIGDIVVETNGSGDAVVMLHGLGGTSNVFWPQAEALSRFFQVTRPDLPGSGRSPANGQISIPSLVQSVVGLLDERRIAAAHLVGHSMGTIVSQHLAVAHPERVRSLALLNPIAAPSDPARTNITARAAKARAEGMAGIADAIVQAGLSAASRSARPEAAAFVREVLMRQDAEGYARNCEALAAAQAADVERLEIPAMLVTGSEDAVSPPATVAALAARFRRARMRVIEGCGHWSTIECSAAVTETLLNFYFSARRD